MKILVYPHEILKQKALPVMSIDGECISIIDEMFKTMYKAKGIGLAANQVGLLKRLIVMDINTSKEGRRPIALINPVIIASEGEATDVEGCLSLPNYSEKVQRAERVIVTGYDRDEKELKIEADGLLARCIQHEIDHLEGLCFVDRLSPLKKLIFRKKWPTLRPQK
ncbi:MAG: peptide deformylase [Dissulfurimicrobium sp.]|uniref:peptide deformylase n=1 Tax=Dissulfurimicrobium sp. TaxID=2022436 RepID=UPI00404A0ED5